MDIFQAPKFVDHVQLVPGVLETSFAVAAQQGSGAVRRPPLQPMYVSHALLASGPARWLLSVRMLVKIVHLGVMAAGWRRTPHPFAWPVQLEGGMISTEVLINLHVLLVGLAGTALALDTSIQTTATAVLLGGGELQQAALR